MAFDRQMFSDKLKRFMSALQTTTLDLAENTGIPENRIQSLIKREHNPTGSEVLIISDFFHEDFNFFISNEQFATFERVEDFFKKNNFLLTKEDRWHIKEFLFLCECESFLQDELGQNQRRSVFEFSKQDGNHYKQHGVAAASAVRAYLGCEPNEIRLDVFSDFMSMGIHIFRRNLGKSAISGFYIKHPSAGKCVLVNNSEDAFRQRFIVAHEVGHAILDDEANFNISLEAVNRSSDEEMELREKRANSFASNYLAPSGYISFIPENRTWTEEKIIKYSLSLKINPEPFAYALNREGLISENDVTHFKALRIPSAEKRDPELPDDSDSLDYKRKAAVLEKGLSPYYVSLCLEAYGKDLISRGRLTEMLLADEYSLVTIANLFMKTV
ncbi:MAG: XRE family transcriptional regulator [Deltaproteobacteria bacterium]|jgi:Zn-dependent peptidase ImmA (M78 family)/plasmid maintenance system antidote protein VapI|nr:XRE family transcriptional regulator [Deltaproteobacteria bacterium]